MAFLPSYRPASRPAGERAPVLAVGRRVFVNCDGDRLGSVALMDESGRPSRARVADGLEVEVVAWRPRAAGGTRYRVRADQADGWLLAGNLRTEAVPARPEGAPVADVAAHPDETLRRFGQRR